jgi:hypothetical protein
MTARCLSLALVLAAAIAPAANAAGPPLPSAASGAAGAVAPGGIERLVTRRAGPDTVVSAVRISDDRVLRSRQIRGRWWVPAVTINGATTGLSVDGSTLVLVRPEPDFPPPTTMLAVLDTGRLSVEREITLPGFFTVDAISPDGRWVYLIQYPGEDLLDYHVRALDTRTGRLDSRSVVDPRNPREQMGGLPMTRVLSRDGRWAYTLYGGGGETFIHALDTVNRTAACIDLEMLPPDSDLSSVELGVSRDGRRVDVRNNGNLVATVDARTFTVSEPGEERGAAPAPGSAPTGSDGDGLPWPALLIGAAVAVACALLFARRRATLNSPRSSSPPTR